MVECKSALKMRWTAAEVAMLTEEWATVCATPEAKTRRGDEMSKTIFDRYNARCARTRQLRRSPLAVATQRDRMFRFAKFVADFDRTALAQGRRAWLDLSNEEQLEVDIPAAWRRQLTTFTQDVFNMFQRVILPKSTDGEGTRRKKSTKRGTKHTKVSSQALGKQQEVVSRVEHQPCWTSEEKVLLVQRWGGLMKHEGLTLEQFEMMTYNKSSKCLASATRSSFTAWRKSRILLSSWRFIAAFNKRHRPGWFDLKEAERDSQITWGELPDNFEDIEREVFLAVEAAVPKDPDQTHVVSEELIPSVEIVHSPFPKTLSPLPLLTDLCPKATTDDTLDRLLLEDDGVDNAATNSELQQPDVCALSGNNFVPDANFLVTQRPPPEIVGGPAIKAEVVSGQPLEPAPIIPFKNAIEELELTHQTYRSNLQGAVCQLQAALEQGNKRSLESLRALKPSQFSGVNAVGLVNYVKLVLEQQNKRMLSALRLAEEMSSQNGAEVRALVQNLLGDGLNPSCNGTTGLDVVVHVTTPSGLVPY
ncbi:hypothetical protein PHYPSEUDO_011503 [Phytophthora pseudosyringae]|uniref:Uncharacterized protein n=1 Tax=Phytophthora pseudosyringae TaxID=221518 RepID=A0A8T1VB73_9STRA|nr:hypothetical protein PHYPSEUDO_011503 [Phytophthora pseudosyringae]